MNDLIFRSASEIHVRKELEASLANGTPLRIKYGIDPTGDRIHIGHASTIRKLRHFQEIGHQVVLIVGSFTAQIGDSSDKDSERTILTPDEIRANMRHYESLLSRIIDIEKTEVHYNHEWFEKMGLDEWLRLNQLFSVAQMVERDNFAKRFASGRRIGLQEFQYPLLQGYDSVAIKADVEIGGTDQLFNLLSGRPIQKHYGQTPQNIITYELLQADDGRKMSKSWENCIWVDDTPEDMYAKVMRINDELIMHYFRICTDLGEDTLAEYERQLAGDSNPRDVKDILAREIVAIYHDEKLAEAAAAQFVSQFREGKQPDDMPEVALKLGSWESDKLLVKSGLVDSKTQARRLLQQGGVRLNEKTLEGGSVQVAEGDVLQVGKRKFVRFRTG